MQLSTVMLKSYPVNRKELHMFSFDLIFLCATDFNLRIMLFIKESCLKMQLEFVVLEKEKNTCCAT